MNKDHLSDELRRVECEVAEGERQLAIQEARVVAAKQNSRRDVGELRLLETMRENQRARQQDRQRLLSLLQP